MQGLFDWFNQNKDWVFSGIGVAVVGTIFVLARGFWRRYGAKQGTVNQKDDERVRPEFQVKHQNLSLDNNWLLLTPLEGLTLKPEVIIKFVSVIQVFNHLPRQLAIVLEIDSIVSNWGIVDNLGEVQREFKHRESFRDPSTNLDDTLVIEAGGTTELIVTLKIPYKAADKQGYLKRLMNMTVKLKFSPVGESAITLPVECDVNTFHGSVEDLLANKFMLAHERGLAKDILKIWEVYWREDEGEAHE